MFDGFSQTEAHTAMMGQQQRSLETNVMFQTWRKDGCQ
jgi:hypothetical protein